MNEAITWLKLYMDNRRIGKNVSQEYIDMVNLLIESCITVQQENTQLKQDAEKLAHNMTVQDIYNAKIVQQLKDKDEKISKVKDIIKKSMYPDFAVMHILEIIENNKED